MKKERLDKALETLKKYKDGKVNLERRVIDAEKWYKMRYYKDIKGGESCNDKSSAWLFNSIMNKHADTMDNMPEPNILPREKSDAEAAQQLSVVVPVVLERSGFEEIYSRCDLAKLKHGTGVYGVFWDGDKLNGLGDVAVEEIDLLNLFWQPGITDIQDSANVFHVELIDNETILNAYPELDGKLGASGIEIAKYIHDDEIDTSEKTPVIDWYYKVKGEDKTTLHYCKIIGEEVLFSSEDSMPNGFYEHGLYPFVFDILFPDAGTPCGFGYIDIMQGAQTQIDMLDDNIIKYAKMATTPRYFVNSAGSVNERDFSDWTKPFVSVSGSNLGADSLRAVELPQLPAIYETIRINKIDELKDTSANKDFAQGSTASGVTAASAIAALQEAGSKQSRERIRGNYRAYKTVCELCIELIRQFYEQPRVFRITQPDGGIDFNEFTNEGLKPQDNDVFGTISSRVPIFDIAVSVQKSSPYSKQVQNELALQLYSMGFFNPENAHISLATLNMMDFNGKEGVLETIRTNGDMFSQMMAMQEQMGKLATIVDAQNGTNVSGEVEGAGQSNIGQMADTGEDRTSNIINKAKGRVADSVSPQ